MCSIPVPEQTGLIHEVGRRTLRQATVNQLPLARGGHACHAPAVSESALQLRNRGFVDDIMQAIGVDPQSSARLAMLSTTINMAHTLKLRVVVEGVETEQQMRQLLSLNCDEMQGFLFSKPEPAEIFEARFLLAVTPDIKL